jgi:hypothetical protein
MERRLLKLEGPPKDEKREALQHAWKTVIPFRDRQGMVAHRACGHDILPEADSGLLLPQQRIGGGSLIQILARRIGWCS